MSRCPECETTITDRSDVVFEQWDETDTGWGMNAPKWLYLVECTDCGAVVGGGAATQL